MFYIPDSEVRQEFPKGQYLFSLAAYYHTKDALLSQLLPGSLQQNHGKHKPRGGLL